jgi:hypothetical protein
VRALEAPRLTARQYLRRLFDLRRQYNMQYVVAVRGTLPTGIGLRPVYANSSFAVYQVADAGSPAAR